MRTTITEQEKLQLLGLLTLGQQHNKIVDQVREAIEKVIEDPNGYSQLVDAIWEYETDIDKLLRNMGIEVENATAELHD